MRSLKKLCEQVWQREFEGFKSGHGDGVSPIVHAGRVVVALQHNGNSAYVALDGQTGRQRWRYDFDSKANWSTPCVFQSGDAGPELIFTNWEYGICGVDPATGEINWNFDVFDKGHRAGRCVQL